MPSSLTLIIVKYVALLAFNRIVVTHPFLVAEQEDVILECIDSEDITIRIKALDLVQGMVSTDNLVSIVSRLMRQLKASSASSPQRKLSPSPDIEGDSEDEALEEEAGQPKSGSSAPPLPEEYTFDVIGRILDMCSSNNYSSLLDFDWYLDVLTQLVRIAPLPRVRGMGLEEPFSGSSKPLQVDISEQIGNELRNVGVKVVAVRQAVIRASELIVSQLSMESSAAQPVVSGALKPVSWILGEYASQLVSPEDTIGYLLQLVPRIENPEVITSSLQSVIKIFSQIAGDDQVLWTPERKSRISLLMARVIHVLEPLGSHPYLEVQERAVEFTELLKLTAEAAAGQAASTDDVQQDAPLLLTQAIPSLFNGWELKSVAVGTQQNVPVPVGLDLDEPIHPNLSGLLAQADELVLPTGNDEEFDVYYNQKPPPSSIQNEPAINRLADAAEEVSSSYQQAGEESYLDPDIVARRKAERIERNRDDPFYIRESSGSGGRSTPIHNILQNENGPSLDIDSIPIMKLDLEQLSTGLSPGAASKKAPKPKPRERIVVAADEMIGGSGPSTPRHYESENNSDSFTKSRAKKLKQSLLQVDSSHLGSLILDGEQPKQGFDYEKEQHEDAEMAQAVKEVERLRLEMQRANERIQVAQGVPVEGTVVKKKKKVKKTKAEDDEGNGDAVKVKKKKKKSVDGVVPEAPGGSGTAESAPSVAAEIVKPKKKKKAARVVQLDDVE